MRNGIETIGQSGNGFSTPVNINPVGTQEVNVDTASAGAEHTYRRRTHQRHPA